MQLKDQAISNLQALGRMTDFWTLNGVDATLCAPDQRATLRLDEPYRGLVNWEIAGETVAAGLLSLGYDSETNPFDWPVADAYVRGSDLVVAYGATVSRPYSLQVSWNVLELPGAAAAVEAQVSVQTELLETHPGFALGSVLPPSASRKDCGLSDGVILLHASQSWSLAEMAPPTDFAAGQVLERPDGALTTNWPMQRDFLEKGVIRRVRVRASALPRTADAKAAEEIYEALCSERPPLSA